MSNDIKFHLVIEAMVADNISKTRKAFLIGIAFFVFYFFVVWLTPLPFEWWIVALLCTLLGAMYANMWLLKYRIEKDYFGDSEDDAREIAMFLQERNYKL